MPSKDNWHSFDLGDPGDKAIATGALVMVLRRRLSDFETACRNHHQDRENQEIVDRYFLAWWGFEMCVVKCYAILDQAMVAYLARHQPTLNTFGMTSDAMLRILHDVGIVDDVNVLHEIRVMRNYFVHNIFNSITAGDFIDKVTSAVELIHDLVTRIDVRRA